MVTEPIGETALLEVLDPQLRPTAALDVPVVESLGSIVSIGDHKPGIRPLLEPFGLVDHPPLTAPGAGRIPSLSQEPHLLAGDPELLLGLCQEVSRQRLESVVAPQRDGVGDAFSFTEGVEPRNGKATIRPQL